MRPPIMARTMTRIKKLISNPVSPALPPESENAASVNVIIIKIGADIPSVGKAD